MSDQPTMSMIEWLLGASAGIVGAALTHIHTRINRVEKTVRENEKTATDGDKALQTLLEERARSDREFREQILRDMVTKADMRDLASELRQSIRDMLGRTPPAA